jgi:hypothetical protein
MGESSPVKTRLSLTNSGICPSTIVHCSAQVEQHRACSGQHSTMTPSSNPYLPPPVVRGPSSRAAPSSSPAGRGRVIPPPQGCSHTLERELAFFLGITRPTPALSLTRCHPQLPRERTSFTYPPLRPIHHVRHGPRGPHSLLRHRLGTPHRQPPWLGAAGRRQIDKHHGSSSGVRFRKAFTPLPTRALQSTSRSALSPRKTSTWISSSASSTNRVLHRPSLHRHWAKNYPQ